MEVIRSIEDNACPVYQTALYLGRFAIDNSQPFRASFGGIGQTPAIGAESEIVCEKTII